jgi:hypothetical protein
MKKEYKFILAIDPSGNFNEGKGTTGWCIFNADEAKVTIASSISSKKYSDMELYWWEHLILIEKYHEKYKDNFIVVLEDYLLYESKMKSQINSRMETPKIIGIIQLYCFMHSIPIILQSASLVKNRWNNDILLYKHYLYKKGKNLCLQDKTILDRHAIDSVRHAVHYATFKNKGDR